MGVTLAEYYRQMGLNVLLIADSTSRWAQAMRETSGRMEEIPGEEAFPAYPRFLHQERVRAGGCHPLPRRVARQPDHDRHGFARGGNFEEPVTQSTLGTSRHSLDFPTIVPTSDSTPAIGPAPVLVALPGPTRAMARQEP